MSNDQVEPLLAALDRIRELTAQRDEFLNQVDTLQCDIASAFGWDLRGKSFDECARECVAQRDELLAALRPFAAMLHKHHTDPDDWPIFAVKENAITQGDLRRAVATIARCEKESV